MMPFTGGRRFTFLENNEVEPTLSIVIFSITKQLINLNMLAFYGIITFACLPLRIKASSLRTMNNHPSTKENKMRYRDLEGTGICLMLAQAIHDPKMEIYGVIRGTRIRISKAQAAEALAQGAQVYAFPVEEGDIGPQEVSVKIFDSGADPVCLAKPYYEFSVNVVADIGSRANSSYVNLCSKKVAHHLNNSINPSETYVKAAKQLGIERKPRENLAHGNL
jgi:hypothetical protein